MKKNHPETHGEVAAKPPDKNIAHQPHPSADQLGPHLGPDQLVLILHLQADAPELKAPASFATITGRSYGTGRLWNGMDHRKGARDFHI